MTSSALFSTAAAVLFFWSGCVSAISFLEAWLKFKAPGMTLPIGLSVGRLIFDALNKIEWIMAIVSMTSLMIAAGGWWNGAGWLAVALIALAVETVWLLPILDRRALAWLSDEPPPPSSIHFVFIAAELIKVGCLVIAGIKILKQ